MSLVCTPGSVKMVLEEFRSTWGNMCTEKDVKTFLMYINVTRGTCQFS